MSNLLKNKTVLITGVTGGIGLEVCKKFYEKGCNIILLGRDEKLLSELSREFNSIFYCCDFNNLDEVENISKKISMDNHIDILINSAGIFEVNSLEETSLQSLKEMFKSLRKIKYNITVQPSEIKVESLLKLPFKNICKIFFVKIKN